MCNQCDSIKATMREQWLNLYLDKGMSIPDIAKLSGYHENTLYLWKARYLKQGLPGLIDKSRTPHSHPNEYSDEIKQRITELRQDKENRRVPGPRTIKTRLKKRYNIYSA